MFIESIVLGFIVAILRKGKIRNIGEMHIKGWYLFLIAALIQGSISWLKGKNLILGTEFFDKYFFYIHLFTYLLMIIGVILNIKKNFMKFILIGMVLNFIVIFANGGKMPVSFKGAKGYEHYTEEMPDKPFDIKHSIISEDTKFVYLADVILLPRPYPLARIISLGDILLMIGVYLFFQESMVKKKIDAVL
ncbi:DUF5317 domain-containing protein [Tissierella sp.]|uniref:DUF5317 domain-containing protein n=1 Tax=Tissierella sp. TaxID=41274 RepID=UPI0028616FB1|nr:DUF5317 domain-containing protein [Tissierella sp.]MDR7857601.1 DUF5317 domain-containing protein [Tissierella sp.]